MRAGSHKIIYSESCYTPRGTAKHCSAVSELNLGFTGQATTASGAPPTPNPGEVGRRRRDSEAKQPAEQALHHATEAAKPSTSRYRQLPAA